MRWIGLAVILPLLAIHPADAGSRQRRIQAAASVPPTLGVPRMVTSNVVVVPAWASRRIAESPVPLYGKSWGRRPWASPLASQATPSAYWARANQLGYGPGPIPGYANGPGIGNIPSAPIGPDGGPGARQGFRPFLALPFYPNQVFTGALTGN